LDLSCNLGVGSAVQTGYRYAFDKGYRFVIRIDGDGQHPPREIPKLVDAILKNDVDLVIGSRYVEKQRYENTTLRSIGIKILAFLLSLICRSNVTDPTSGFWVINRKLLYYFAHDYPAEYPEPEAIALLRRHGFRYLEIPVEFRPRTRGKSTIHGFGAIYYMIKVSLALIIDRIRPLNRRFEKSRLKEL
ncbi:MAG: glycosyltransferase family 2 protein, partial [Deltaproteobacteria bacterium]|nr:glycosyltransferase family 2 protein [Deltaproteobacteria bacterium]